MRALATSTLSRLISKLGKKFIGVSMTLAGLLGTEVFFKKLPFWNKSAEYCFPVGYWGCTDAALGAHFCLGAASGSTLSRKRHLFIYQFCPDPDVNFVNGREGTNFSWLKKGFLFTFWGYSRFQLFLWTLVGTFIGVKIFSHYEIKKGWQLHIFRVDVLLAPTQSWLLPRVSGIL